MEQGFTALNWMKYLNGEKKLSEINLPGTHDSGTKYVEKGEDMYRCQFLSVEEQMEIGVRYFDLRCVAVSKEESPGIKHDKVWCLNSEDKKDHLHLDKLIQDAKGFLKKYPTETIIFQIKNETWNQGDKILAHHIEKYIKDGCMWACDRLPKLDEVRGRIVLVRRFSYSDKESDLKEDEFGLNLSSWDSECMWKGGHNTFVKVNGKAFVQDRYLTDAKEKLALLHRALDEMSDPKRDPAFGWCINLASCTKPNPQKAAKDVNENLKQSPEFWDGRKLGTFVVDFAKDTLISSIFLSNFMEKEGLL